MRCLSTLLFIVLLTASSLAATIVVDVNGTGDHDAISDAITAAASGDTILVEPGVYNGYRNRLLDFEGRHIELRSTDGPDNTVIDGEGVVRLFFFRSGEDTTLVVEGFHFMSGYADSGGIALISNASSPKFLDCTFSDCSYPVTKIGGAVCNTAGSPVFEDCRFLDNICQASESRGGAVFSAGGSPVFRGCEFAGNACLTSDSHGGGAYSTDGTPTFWECTFTGNTCSGSDSYGGALALFGQTLIELHDCSFQGNSAVRGGGVYSYDTFALLYDCTFQDNHASELGNGVACVGAAPLLDACVFDSDAATGDSVAVSISTSDVLIQQCTFVGGQGPSVKCFFGSPRIEQCVFAFGERPAVNLYGTPTFTHCVVFGHSASDSLPEGATDNAFVDPNFCGLLTRDFTLCADSPCLAANNTWGEDVGALGEGCSACGSAVETTSWGRIKAMYRSPR